MLRLNVSLLKLNQAIIRHSELLHIAISARMVAPVSAQPLVPSAYAGHCGHKHSGNVGHHRGRGIRHRLYVCEAKGAPLLSKPIPDQRLFKACCLLLLV